MVQDFQRLLSDDRIKSFMEIGIERFDDENYPFLSYIGVDFKGADLLSLKLYMHGYKKHAVSDLKPLFPKFELIEDEYSKFSETKYSLDASEYQNDHPLGHMGTLFKFKLTKSGDESSTFFIRPKGYDHGPMTELELPEKEGDKLIDDYYSCEQSGNRVLFKRYYPIEKPTNIRFTLDKFNFSDVPVEDVGILEYLEYDGRMKIAMSFKENSIQKYIPESARELTDFLSENYWLNAMGLGRCKKSKIQSLYFMSNAKRRFFKDSLTFQSLLGESFD